MTRDFGCVNCGEPISSGRVCPRCSRRAWFRSRYVSGGTLAGRVAERAIRAGHLPKPKGLACADCGGPAEQYDHRDYNKPLDVAPVCRRCNKHRGAAIPKRWALGEWGEYIRSALDRAWTVTPHVALLAVEFPEEAPREFPFINPPSSANVTPPSPASGAEDSSPA